MPRYVKRQTPNEYTRSLTRKRTAKKIFDGYFVDLTGGLNDSISTYSFEVFMTANQLLNHLHAAFSHDLLFHTRDTNLSTMGNIAIDHALHSPLTDNIVLQQVGVRNKKTYKDYDDYGDHIPVWINFKLAAPIVIVRLRKPLPAHKCCDISISTEVVRQN
jgi:hypothetical protein